MNKGEGLYYKIARPDGWDFHTGTTINYREALGREVMAPSPATHPKLCAPGVLHASRVAEDCFRGGSIPCSLYRVQGTPVVEDKTKAGFLKLAVVKELDPAAFFKWRYAEAANPTYPLKIQPPVITPEHLAALKVWASVWDSVRDSVWASVRDSVWDSVRDSVGDSVWASVWDSVWDSVRASVGASVWASVRASVWAYMGWIFAPIEPSWQRIYPFQSIVDLWHLGLVPSYDRKVWRLHGGKRAEILWEGKV